MRYWNWIGAAGLLVAMVWSLSDDNPKSASRVTKASDVQQFQVETKITRTPAAVATTAPSEVTKPAKLWAEQPFKYQADLDLFAKIRSKVFLSEEEKTERNRILNDASLLRALGLRLTEASLSPSVKASQDLAVDLLIEALKTGDKAMASEVAKAVIEDAQVENSSLERGVRENLAGIKAEVLYHWAAYMPQDAAGIERYLPGPVSQKIWANVARKHASNAAESAAEAAGRK